MVIPACLSNYHCLGGKCTMEHCNSKENDPQILFPVTKFKLSSGNVNFEKLVFADLSLTAS